MKPNRRTRLFGLLAVLVLAMIGFGVKGWMLDGKTPGDAIYRSLQAFTLGDAYGGIHGEPPREVTDPVAVKDAPAPAARPWLEGARWIGAVLAFYAVFLLLWSGLESWRTTMGARGRRKHLAVVGDTPFADRLSEAASGDGLKRKLKLKVVQLRDPGQGPTQGGRLIRLPFNGFDRDGFDEAGAARARRLVVAVADDGAAVDLALAAQRRYPKLPVLTRLRDRRLLHTLRDLPGGETLRAFSESEAAAREIVRRHPLFLLAEERGQPRIHALIIGDEDWVEALLSEIVLSSRTLTLDKPKLTLAVADPAGLKARLAVRYPELDKEAELAFVGFDPLTLAPEAAAAQQADTITAAYCAFDDGARSLVAALALKGVARFWAGFGAPIFVRVSGDQGLKRPAAGTTPAALDVIPFGSMTDVIHAAGIVSEASDSAERAWHEAYLRLFPDSGAALPWDQLSEEYRLSNRRAVAHVYAKLHDAGFDLRPWLATADPWDELPALAPGELLFRDDAELMKLAVLEHERWNADRRLLGWRYGATKDNARKLHPCLVDFEDLTPEIQNYDVELVRGLNKILARKKGGLARP